ncbi:DUF3027 domain-containing protein [Enteractinococcus coprophilus]|uniref:DUF3027 family protein n=1 Tax=Enteractinococcus coprophilus TaxID=1027633 RepID=A0A543AFP7_9MICC|nr:DUF3027 domain-containing protein [Enteractinococcus coprophilus]TQL71392.1 DUF3027 family protein [Enteractinococcus coprophilus]
MHLMPDVAEDTVTNTEPVYPTFGPPRSMSRKPRVDTVLADAVDIAREALEGYDGDIGEHLGTTADDERVVTHRFAAHVPGYRGWHFFVTLARAPRSKMVTISETGMLPGEGALLAPAWVPWRDRASAEERIRLDAIAAGEDPAKALEAAGFGPKAVEEVSVASTERPVTKDHTDKAKQARREAKRRRARQQAARRKQKKKSAGSNTKPDTES